LQRIQPNSRGGTGHQQACGRYLPVLAKPAEAPVPGQGRVRFRFLCSPQAIHADATGRIDRLTVTENILAERDGSIACKATDKTADLDVDTMIFAIGDVADPDVGLPTITIRTLRTRSIRPQRAAYELFDPQNGKPMAGMYAVAGRAKPVTGWWASHGMTPKWARSTSEYLESAADSDVPSLQQHMERKGLRVVSKPILNSLAARRKIAQDRGMSWFKFAEDKPC